MKEITRDEAIILICRDRLKSLGVESREGYILDFWGIDTNSKEFSDLSEKLKKEILSSEYPVYEVSNKRYDKLILSSLKYEFKGVTNSYISTLLLKNNLGEYVVNGKIENLESCPCCNYKTLNTREEFDVCRLCYWEDIPKELKTYMNPNRSTLNKASQEFEKRKDSMYDVINKKFLRIEE